MDALLCASHISKIYDGRTVLKDINLKVRKGEAVAFVGENGCGKSTLLRVLSGLTKPTGGKVMLSPETTIGFIPDRYEKITMTAERFLKHMAGMDGERPDVLKQYCKAFFLEGMLDTPMKYLSKGTLQKVAVVQALIGERDMLLVDEPLSGQDAASQANFAEEIKKRKKGGTAIIMACHEPYLIEELADSIYQIKDGALLDGTGYLFSCAKPRFMVLLEYRGETQALLEAIADEGIRESVALSMCGQLIRLEADRKYAAYLLALFVSQNVRIVKFEEI